MVKLQEKKRKHRFCVKHDCALFYFCIPCKASTCPECYIEDHTGHKKKRIDTAYAAAKSKIDELCEAETNKRESLWQQEIREVDRIIADTEICGEFDAEIMEFTDRLKDAVRS